MPGNVVLQFFEFIFVSLDIAVVYMDANSETSLGELSRFSMLDFVYDSLGVNNSPLLAATCAMCQRNISFDNEMGSIESLSLCSDCKFLLLEDLQTSSPDVYQRRMPVSRRTRYGSPESMESMSSQQFSQMINNSRQTHSSSAHEYQSADGDSSARLVQRTNSRTPSGSRRWRRVFSDTESDGLDSVYGETESNVSFRRYMLFHRDADAVSYSAYGGDSDASIDGQSVMGNDNSVLPGGGSDVDSDTDIDPMNAGLYHWNSEDQEGDEDDSEWEEADIESNTVDSSRHYVNDGYNLRREFLSPDGDGSFMLIRERIQAQTADLLTNFEESETQMYMGDSGDYLDARGFDTLLEHLAETENLRRGAPPASESFLKNMPLVKIKEDHDKLESLACAVCKELITVGTVVSQLPCSHLYHPNCILPWLTARNTCPLCRFELPTDDKDYEDRKRTSANEIRTFHVHDQLTVNDDNSVDALANEPSPGRVSRGQREVTNANTVAGDDARENRRSRWLFLAAAAAAPIASVVGISLMLWFGKAPAGRRLPTNQIAYRRETNQRRWWSLF